MDMYNIYIYNMVNREIWGWFSIALPTISCWGNVRAKNHPMLNDPIPFCRSLQLHPSIYGRFYH